MSQRIHPSAAGAGGLHAELSGPIRVRRPKRWGRKIFFSLLTLCLFGVGWMLLRVALMPYPAIAAPHQRLGDGWKLLRGVINVPVPDPSKPDAVRQIMANAFEAGLDFMVLAEPGGLRLKDLAAQAPLAVVLAQDVRTSRGSFLSIGANRAFADGEMEAGAVFERVVKAEGLSVVVRARDLQGAWLAWEELTPDLFEFHNGRTQSERSDWRQWVTRSAGWVLGSDAAHDHLGVRPQGLLAHWDDYSRKRRVLGLCGLDGYPDLKAMQTFVFVKNGLGPYGPREVLAALRHGRSFCALPIYGDPTGFRFFAVPAAGGVVLGHQGEQVDLGEGVELMADMNLPGELSDLAMLLYKDGEQIVSVAGGRLSHKTLEPGTYRIEVHVTVDAVPWGSAKRVFVYSNPIFVVAGGGAPEAP